MRMVSAQRIRFTRSVVAALFTVSVSGHVAAQSSKPPAGPTHTFQPYGNARFGFWIEYPDDLLTPKGESDNGDGQVFEGKSGKLTASGSYLAMLNDDGSVWKFRQYFDWDVKLAQEAGDKVTYKVSGATWFVISGFRKNGRIFYERVITDIEQSRMATFSLEYEPSVRSSYDSLVDHLTKTFKLDKSVPADEGAGTRRTTST